MKICFYTNSVFTFGGVQRILAVLAKQLSRNHQITILTLESPSLKDTTMYNLNEADIEYIFINYAESPIYEYIPSRFYSFLYKKFLPQNRLFSEWYGHSSFPKSKNKHLISILNERDYDIIVGVHVFLSFHLASIKDKIKAKTIGWMHNSFDAFFKIDLAYIKGLKNFFRYQMRKLDQIIVLSEYDRNRYVDELHVYPKVIYNPVTILPDKKKSWNKKFLAIGRFTPLHKGFDILIKAFALFALHDNDWTLDIVGEGPEKGYFDSLIEQYQMRDRISLFPFTKNVEDFYKNAGIFVLSSRWEGLPLVLLEAMSYGLPIISSDIPVAKELLDENNTALFFEKEDVNGLTQRMIEVVNMNRDELKEMSDNALLFVENFSINKIILQWEDLLNDLKDTGSNTP